jgi:uncharacterized protein YjbJ (UPF0337 family)
MLAREMQSNTPVIDQMTELLQHVSRYVPATRRTETGMDKDRVEGAAKEVKGSIKETAGKLTGDEKLKTEGKMDKATGKVQNAVGGAKDALRDSAKH